MADINLTSTQASGFKKTDFDQIKQALQDGLLTINVEALKVGSIEIIDAAGTIDVAALRETAITAADMNLLIGGTPITLHTHSDFIAHASDATIHFTKSSIDLNDLGDTNVGSATDGQSLIYQAGTGTWIPGTPTTGDITGVYGNTPLFGGGSSGDVYLSIYQANGLQSGYLSSTDWTTFNNKADATVVSNHIADTTIHFTKNSILLNDLGDVNVPTPSINDVLYYNGNWVNTNQVPFKNTNEIITGKWTFNTSPTIPYPSLDYDAVSKNYVDAFAQGLKYVDPVISKSYSDPPVTSQVGDRYIVGTSPTGAWSGNYNDIGEWNGGAWDYTLATSGLATFVADEESLYVYSDVNTSWVKFSSVSQHNNLGGLQGGTTNEYYHLTANEHDNVLFSNSSATISASAVFTFNTSPVIPLPSLDNHAVNKAYVNSLKFTNLSDTPTSYIGQAGDILKVTTSEDGLYFADNDGGQALQELIAHTSRADIHFLTSQINLSDLADTLIQNPADEDHLIYDSSLGKWVSKRGGFTSYIETISSWVDNGDGRYYADVTHNFNSYDVAVFTYDNDSKNDISVDTIEKLNLNTIRIYITNNTSNIRVVILELDRSVSYAISLDDWNDNGDGRYYADIEHGLYDDTIIVQAYDESTKEVVGIESDRINEGIVRIYSTDSTKTLKGQVFNAYKMKSYIVPIVSWTNNGDGRWYSELKHFMGTFDTVIQFFDTNTKETISLDTVNRTNGNLMRVYTTDNTASPTALLISAV